MELFCFFSSCPQIETYSESFNEQVRAVLGFLITLTRSTYAYIPVSQLSNLQRIHSNEFEMLLRSHLVLHDVDGAIIMAMSMVVQI